MKCFSLLVLSMIYAMFEASATTLLRGGNQLHYVEGQSALSEVASSVMQTMGSTLKAMISTPWITLGLLAVVMLFLVIVSWWSLAMRETSPATPDRAPRAPAPPERRRSGIPQTAPAGITVRVPQTRLPTGRTVPKPPNLPDVAGMPADARPSIFKSRPSTAIWQGASPEVTQYRVWEDPNRPKTAPAEAEAPESRSSHCSHDEETHTLVNFLRPPSFDSQIPGAVPEASEVQGWHQMENAPQRMKSMGSLPLPKSQQSLKQALDREAKNRSSV